MEDLSGSEVKAVLGPGPRGQTRLEQAFLQLCERHRIPLPRLNVKVEGWLVDALWPHQRVVVELDGYPGHRTRAQLERDHQRDLELRAAGVKTARYSKTQIDDQGGQVANDVRALLGEP
jgi:very-short-patch-repair endonuclease